jgi:hypothetical protein
MTTHAEKTQVNKSPLVVQEASRKNGSSESMFQFVDNRPETVIQRKLREMADNSQQTNPVIQRVEKNIIVTGVSHLVKMNKKSLHASEKEMEIHHGQELIIETESKVRSRRGPNQEIYKDEDAEGEHIYNWFKVISLEGKPVETGFYIRADVFEEVKAEKGKGKIVKGLILQILWWMRLPKCRPH